MPQELGFKRAQLAFDLEVTLGTAATLTAADVTDRVIEPRLRIVRVAAPRPKPEGEGTAANVPGRTTTTLNFGADFRPSGSATTAPAGLGKLLQACGFKDATGGVFNQTSNTNDWKTLTAELFRAGRKKIGRGMMGTFDLELTSGDVPRFDFSFLGGWQAKPSEASAYTSVTYDDNEPPVWGGSGSLTIGGSAVFKPQTMRLSMGGGPIMRPDPNSPRGVLCGWLSDRTPKLTLDPESVALATKDWADMADSAGTVDLVAIVGTTAGYQMKVTLNDLQLENHPDEEDRDNIMVDALGFDVTGGITIEFP